jgi:hypothetical protein
LPELCEEGAEGRFRLSCAEVCERCADQRQGWCLLGLYGDREMIP